MHRLLLDSRSSLDDLVLTKERLIRERNDLTSRLELSQSKLSSQKSMLEDEVDAMKVEKGRLQTELEDLKEK